MKKVLSVILSLALTVGLVACGKNGENGATSSFSTDAQTSTETVVESEKNTSSQTSLEESTVQPSRKEGASEKETEKSTLSQSATEETVPVPSQMDNSTKTLTAVYGKRTGTSKTYTGLEPLSERKLPIVDPENLRKLDETEFQHSFGVAKNGKPHEISVNNQKMYEKYGALCLDTSGEKVIYLTFDCGYENGCTAKILDTLKEKKVPAAFFVTLPHVKSNPELIARMINEGHTVGNHSVNHPNFSTISRTQMAEEIEGLDNYLRVNFGYSSPFFRFPEGACSESALDLVQNAHYKSVFWSCAYADWDISNPKGKQYAFDTVTSRLHSGCVLLLHAVSPDNAEALGDIIDYAVSQGYTFKSL